MTTEIIHGNPGSYKSSALVSLFLLPALKENRTIVTNIRGFVSLDELNEIYQLKTPSKSKIILVPHTKDGFETMARFFHWVEKGACILMDEGQRIYPTRLTKLSIFDLNQHDDPDWPLSVEEAFDKHRHNGWDIYITTTNISKIHKEIRQVAEFAYRHKNMSGLIPFLKNRYKRVQHDPENNGKSISHVLSSSIKKIDTRSFNAYQSTTTGKAKTTKTSNALLGSPRILMFGCLAIFSIIYMLNLFATNGSIMAKSESVKKTQNNQVSISDNTLPASNISHDNDRYRLNNKISIEPIIRDIEYLSSIIRLSNYDTTYYFLTSKFGTISSYELSRFDVTIKEYPHFMLLSYNQTDLIIPIGNPNPDYYHPDNNQNNANFTTEAAHADDVRNVSIF